MNFTPKTPPLLVSQRLQIHIFLMKMTQQWTEVVAAGATGLYWVFWTEALATLAIVLHLSNDVRLHGHLGNQQKTWAKIAKEGLVFSESGRATWRNAAGIITKVIHTLNWQPSIIDVLEWYKEEDRDESKKGGTDGGRNYITTEKKITRGKTVQIIQKIMLLYNNQWFGDAPLVNINYNTTAQPTTLFGRYIC